MDRWLWAVRLIKTRSDAAAACRGGHVRVNDRPAKPATMVSPGDQVRARVGNTTRIVEVARVIEKRVGPARPTPPPVSSTTRRPRRQRHPCPSPAATEAPGGPRNETAGFSTSSARDSSDRPVCMKDRSASVESQPSAGPLWSGSYTDWADQGLGAALAHCHPESRRAKRSRCWPLPALTCASRYLCRVSTVRRGWAKLFQ